jgi:hypothetical protein
MYHSISQRYARAGKVREAAELLLAGIDLLSTHAQWQSAEDLTKRLWDLLSGEPEGRAAWKATATTTPALSAQCVELFGRLDMSRPETDAFAEGLIRWVDACMRLVTSHRVRWCRVGRGVATHPALSHRPRSHRLSVQPGFPQGDPSLHHAIGFGYSRGRLKRCAWMGGVGAA